MYIYLPMLEALKHINPEELTDVTMLQKLLLALMNVCETQAGQIAELTQKNQALADEINRLKGEHGSMPPPKKPVDVPESPSTTGSKENPTSKSKSKNRKKGRKNPTLPIDEVVECAIDKSTLPPDAKLKKYREVIQQDIDITRKTVLYRIPVYYSECEGKTYSGQLPESYVGQFGDTLKSWIQLLHYQCDMTQGRIKGLLDTLEISISTGTISNIILSNSTQMVGESLAILRSGLEKVAYAQMDGTKSLESGVGKTTQVISSPCYSVYYTMDSKSKANVIWALQGKEGESVPLLYNPLAIDLLKQSTVAKKDQLLLGALLPLNQRYSLIQLEELLAAKAPHLLNKSTYPTLVNELAIAYYQTQTDFPKPTYLLSDAGPEYGGITPHHALCWIHEERHYKKMTPVFAIHRELLAKIRGQIWDFYKKLLIFKEQPPDYLPPQFKERLRSEFDTIFQQSTNYEELNKRLEKTFAKKDQLLKVLDFPDLPLHNNAAELAVRRKVRKRDISFHTMSSKGTATQDAFMSVIQTAKKLGVNALAYLKDRLSKKYQLPSLAEQISNITT